jgi:polyketide biosynthesis enoyl-CoA hydratase PksI
MEYASELATTIAEKPRVLLVTLKDHLVAYLREGFSKVIDQEVSNA